MSKDLFQQLKDLQNETNAGFVSSDSHLEGRQNLMQAIGSRETTNESWSTFSILDLAHFIIGDFFAKPAVAMTSIVLIAFGSITTVNASTNSLPGDPLYGLKVATERAQLQLANNERRATLHTEFAERRLQELLEISSNHPERHNLIHSTAEAYRKELSLISSRVDQDNGSSSISTSEITGRLNTLSDILAEKADDEIKTSLTDATRQTSDNLVERAVTVHESRSQAEDQSSDYEITRRELQQIFTTRYNAINTRRTMLLGRITSLEMHEDIDEVASTGELRAVKSEIAKVQNKITEAFNFAARHDYRTAFSTINQSNNYFIELEAQITEIETSLIEFLNPEPIIEEVVEDSEADTEEKKDSDEKESTASSESEE